MGTDGYDFVYKYVNKHISNFFIQNVIPKTIHANYITLAAALNLFIAFICIFIFEWTQNSVVWCLVTLNTWMYLILDGADGMQARRCNTCSTEGEMFDHALDALFGPVCFMLSAYQAVNHLEFLQVIHTSCCVFLLPHVLAVITKKPMEQAIFGLFGPDFIGFIFGMFLPLVRAYEVYTESTTGIIQLAFHPYSYTFLRLFTIVYYSYTFIHNKMWSVSISWTGIRHFLLFFGFGCSLSYLDKNLLDCIANSKITVVFIMTITCCNYFILYCNLLEARDVEKYDLFYAKHKNWISMRPDYIVYYCMIAFLYYIGTMEDETLSHMGCPGLDNCDVIRTKIHKSILATYLFITFIYTIFDTVHLCYTLVHIHLHRRKISS
jgi:phosphatidylglycerophosphate synthase